MPVRRALLADPVLEVAPQLLGMVLRATSPDGTVAVRLTEVEAYDGPNDPGSHAYRGQTPRNAVMFGPPGHLYVYFTYGMHFCMNISAGPDGQPSAILLRAGEIIEGHDLARSRRGIDPPAVAKFNQTAASSGIRPARTPGIGARRASSSEGEGLLGGSSPQRDELSTGARSSGLRATREVLPGSAPARTRAKHDPDRDLARGPARMCVALGIDREDNGVDLLARDSPVQLLPGDGFDGEPATGPRVGLREAADWNWRFWIPGDPTVSPYRPHVPKRRS